MTGPRRRPQRLLLARVGVTAALAVTLAVVLANLGDRLQPDPGRRSIARAPTSHERNPATHGEPAGAPSAVDPARERAAPATETAAASEEGPAGPPLLGVVRGVVTRPRDGSRVTEGVVAITFVPLGAPPLPGRDAFAALDEEQRGFLHDFDETRIEEDGTFRLRLPAPSIVRTAVLRPKLQGGFAAQFLETEQPLFDVELRPEQPLELALEVDDGACIEGRIVAAEGGFPLSGARVEIPWWSDDWSDWACVTDHEGRFRVAGIRREVAGARSHSEAIVRCAGFVTERFLVPPAGDDLDVHDLEFALTRGVRIEVQLAVAERATAPGEVAATGGERSIAGAALLLPAAAIVGDPLFARPAWIAQVPLPIVALPGEIEVDFVDVPSTRDVVLLLRLSDGRTRGPVVLDGSGDRGRQPVSVLLDDSRVAPAAASSMLRLRLRDPEGAALADGDVSFAIAGGGFASSRRRTDESGCLEVATPAPGCVLSLRVARRKTAHLLALAAPQRSGASADDGTSAVAGELSLTLEMLPTSRR
jgi:hypothetical protein